MNEEQGRKLESWKEIAAYLGRDERTALRWVKLGLPIHKMPSGIRGRVFAYTDEIDAWRTGHSFQIQNGQQESNQAPEVQSAVSIPTVPRRWHLRAIVWTVSVVLVAFLALAVVVVRPSSVGSPAHYEVSGTSLTVRDNKGQVVWSHNFGFPLYEALYRSKPGTFPTRQVARFDDLDGDGQVEFLFVVFPDTSQGASTSYLYCFGSRGEVLWRYRPERSVRYGDETFGPPFLVDFFHFSRAQDGREPIIWAVAHHNPWFPTVIAKLDLSGHVQAEYWHAGHVSVIEEAEVNSKRSLLIGATNNELFTAVLSVLPFDSPQGSSPALSEKYRCMNCPSGEPLFYVVFPRTRLSRVLNSRPEVTQIFVREGPKIEVTVRSGNVPSGLPAGEFFEFDSNFHLKQAEVTENYATAYAELRVRGLIRDPLDRKRESEALMAVRFLNAPGTIREGKVESDEKIK